MVSRVFWPGIVAWAVGFAPALNAADPPPPGGSFSLAKGTLTAKEFAAAFATATGYTLDVSALDGDSKVPADLKAVSYWAAMEHLATHTKSRLSLVGDRIAFKPAAEPVPSSIAGPFRVSAQEVVVRRDFAAGSTGCELHLEVAWLPALNVYRTDTAPVITSLTDDAGAKLTDGSSGARTFTTGMAAALVVRPQGVTRAAKSLTVAGTVRLTMADELLTFPFDAAGKPLGMKQQGIGVTVVKMKAAGADLLVTVRLDYPPGNVVWESFEDNFWTRGNRLRLLPPKGDPITADVADPEDRTITYTFKNRAGKVGADWTLDYRTPGPMREVTVPFELKGVVLP